MNGKNKILLLHFLDCLDLMMSKLCDCNSLICLSKKKYVAHEMIPETEPPFALDMSTIANKQSLDSLCSKSINSINENENLIGNPEVRGPQFFLQRRILDLGSWT